MKCHPPQVRPGRDRGDVACSGRAGERGGGAQERAGAGRGAPALGQEVLQEGAGQHLSSGGGVGDQRSVRQFVMLRLLSCNVVHLEYNK